MIQQSPSWVYVQKKTLNSKRWLYSHVHCSSVHSSQVMEATYVHQQMSEQSKSGTCLQWNIQRRKYAIHSHKKE